MQELFEQHVRDDADFRDKTEEYHRENTRRLDRIADHLASQDRTLSRIETQTVKTNGSVADLKGWQSYMKGGLTILSILVVPVLLYIITKGI